MKPLAPKKGALAKTSITFELGAFSSQTKLEVGSAYWKVIALRRTDAKARGEVDPPPLLRLRLAGPCVRLCKSQTAPHQLKCAVLRAGRWRMFDDRSKPKRQADHNQHRKPEAGG